MNDLFNAAEIPFNLSGEQIDNSVTAEGVARVRALAESEARKAQKELFAPRPAMAPNLCRRCGDPVYFQNTLCADCERD